MSRYQDPMSDETMWRIIRGLLFSIPIGIAGILAIEVFKPVLIAILRGAIS